MKPDKRWTILPVDDNVVNGLSEALKINPAVCRILALRGIKDYESETFLSAGVVAIA
jgi:single-stranded-DNA-specific exonuclease